MMRFAPKYSGTSNLPRRKPRKMTYICSVCSLGGRRLWRPYDRADSLTCVTCLNKETGKVFLFEDSDQISPDWIPAVPVEDSTDDFWSYGSVPDNRVAWWYSLPAYTDDAKAEAAGLRNVLMRKIYQVGFLVSLR